MKTLSSIILLFLFLTKGFASGTNYLEAMKANIDALYKSTSVEEFQAAVNSFERIAEVEKTK